MRLKEIIAGIEKDYPREYACDWDNCGLQAGSKEQEVQRVYISLDPDAEAVEAAVGEHAQLLLTHHPLLFAPIRNVTDDSLQGRKLLRLIAAGTACYAMHTNYDVLGMAELSEKMLDLREGTVLEEVRDGQGIGRTGLLPKEMTLAECARYVKACFQIPSVKFFGCPDQAVRRAALSPGAGKSMAAAALKAGAQVLITGDIDHHTGIDAADAGMAVIDAGHYGMEHIFIADMKRYLTEKFPELKVLTAPVKQPFISV